MRTMHGWALLLTAFVIAGCASGISSAPVVAVTPASDVAAIRAVFDTTAALHYDHLEVRPLGPDHALATGEYILSGAGQPDRTGWFSTIWERTPTGWRMIHDHS